MTTQNKHGTVETLVDRKMYQMWGRYAKLRKRPTARRVWEGCRNERSLRHDKGRALEAQVAVHRREHLAAEGNHCARTVECPLHDAALRGVGCHDVDVGAPEDDAVGRRRCSGGTAYQLAWGGCGV